MTDISQYQDNKDHPEHFESDVGAIEVPIRDEYEPAFIRKTMRKVNKW